ncbi:carbohydrate ABC transporter substrate-binding protein (CUT1 family) [Actinophytocola oryzae]|uniref:Carbohydrate ABC transporter substrate-binding protein (CUT1 family) n=1 Tax=Actinophytocola oryzae TaxID=502181 RepID=A0A4R7VY41_9PSEU|nr:carbohydrate ABC transporter substrate-binding protein (CUT1 family) [Actinophytocola oryzae]
MTINFWHGQGDTAVLVIEDLVADFERSHPNIKVDTGGGVLSDAMLQKVLAALAAGSYPDVAYIFGSDLANIARSPKVVDMGDTIAGTNYWKPVRDAVMINGQVRAAPALVDSLAVVCNKTVFSAAGVDLPKENWRWDDFVSTAKALTNVDTGTFGTGWPGAGDEDTVWRLWPLVWDAGGDVIGSNGRGIGFADAGVEALEVVRDLARDKSVYIDPKSGSEQMYQVYNSGRMGMVVTGPWQLPDILDAGVDYEVVPLPSFNGKPVTISGPDTWTVFDNGAARVEAARTFVSWLIQPEQDVRWALGAGSLPLSQESESSPEWSQYAAETPGLKVFATALESARVRPVHPAYPDISQALATAITSVLLGKSTPEEAMRTCADEADAALRIPR